MCSDTIFAKRLPNNDSVERWRVIRSTYYTLPPLPPPQSPSPRINTSSPFIFWGRTGPPFRALFTFTQLPGGRVVFLPSSAACPFINREAESSIASPEPSIT
ncbi:hypothetical protein J6590_017008 [Homalodisca vitripennis]|nr:hypothetical protein J6590_017008 [Homalodisca vitripennis]